jgi:hypothetical protein
MKRMYCWRCCEVVPMLDEEEFARVSQLYSEGMRATKEFRQKHSLPLADASFDDQFRPVRDEYERLTGWKDMHQSAVIHHRISLYGPLCPECGKPLRSPSARFCAGCGYKRKPNQVEGTATSASVRPHLD